MWYITNKKTGEQSKSSVHFLIGCFVFLLLLSWSCPLCILDINLFSDTLFANILSHSTGCPSLFGLFLLLNIRFQVLYSPACRFSLLLPMLCQIQCHEDFPQCFLLRILWIQLLHLDFWSILKIRLFSLTYFRLYSNHSSDGFQVLIYHRRQ